MSDVVFVSGTAGGSVEFGFVSTNETGFPVLDPIPGLFLFETGKPFGASIRRSTVSMWRRAKARGVSMRVILDALQAGNATSQADALRKAGITLKLMRGIKGSGIMHHKVAIYDGAVVQTGSFNWTDNASCCSWENAVFIGAAEVVKNYQQMFELMWNQN